MACFHPLDLYRNKDGSLSGTKPAGQVPRPVTIACGKCRGCLLERSRQWAVRCVHEAKMHEDNSFITLTYDNEHLPADFSLDLSHWQKFAKRLRKKLGPFRFFHCGEYGEGSEARAINPHYHAILFGQDFSADRKHYKFTPQGHALYTSELLTETWGKGSCRIGSVTHQSASYVARYCLKKMSHERAKEHYQGRKPEYATMSRNPGLGANWIKQYQSDVYPHDFVVNQDGSKSRPPTFYDRQVPEELLEQMKEKRKQDGIKRQANSTPARLAVREKCLISKTSSLTRAL